MKIKELKLTNYRNHTKNSFKFTDDTNLILGPNGAGKTNILEAINMLSTTKSFRAKYDRDVINYEADFATVEGITETNDTTDSLMIHVAKSERSPNTSSKKVKYNNTAKSLNKFSGYFLSVLFSPEDIEIVSGSPSSRRKYLDTILSQASAKYKKALSDYIKTIRRRNKLLEAINETGNGADQLPFWNNKLLEFGEIIQKHREELITHFNSFISTDTTIPLYKGNNIGIEYKKNSVDTKRLLEYKDKEVAAKNTLIGPHRDDFTIMQNSRNIAFFGSRGEQRTAIYAIKLAEIDYLETHCGNRPVLLLDDIFSELDNEHRELVLDLITNQQTVITSAAVPQGIDVGECNLIRL